MLAFISFTTPLLLAGLALLSLPIVAHLLQRHARKELVFPTVAFLLQAVATQSRFHRLKRWLLLLLRLLAVACIVLAFARPVWFDVTPAQAANADQAAAVVLLVDASASSAQQINGVACLEQLRAGGNRALDSLRSGTDVANIVYAEAAPRAAFPRLSPNLPALRADLEKLHATQERADLPAALALAGQLLREHRGAKRLVILSDLQATNWAEALEDAKLGDALPIGTIATVQALDDEPPANVALSQPRVFPARPIAGQSCELAVHVENDSTATRQVRVRLHGEQGGGSATDADQTISLIAGEVRDVIFPATAPTEGALLATFSIAPDGLDADNQAFVVVEASTRIPILLVSDDSPAEPGTAAYYLLRALAPHDDATDRFEVRHKRVADLTNADFTAVSGVIVGYVGELSPAAAKLLVDYTDAGGGVLFFSGEGPVPRNLSALQAAAGTRELLPWTPGTRREVAGREESYRITGGRWQSRWFREFDEQSQLAIGRIHFDRSWFVPAPSGAAEILLTFADGQPALGLRAFGKGQFLVANFGLDPASNDLGKHGAFVALMQILARSLSPEGESARPSFPGTPYAFPRLFAVNDVRGSAEVIGPDGKSALSTTTTSPEGVRIDLPKPAQCGFYQARAGDRLLGAVAINLDPRESDLKRITPDRLTERLRARGIASETTAPANWDPMLNLSGRPLWGSFFVAALCAIGLELFLLGLWRH